MCLLFIETSLLRATGVLGMLDLLLLTSLTPEQGGYVKVMQVSAEGLMQVLNEILDFSKIQSGHLALEIVDFHIGELLEQVRLGLLFTSSTSGSFAYDLGPVQLNKSIQMFDVLVGMNLSCAMILHTFCGKLFRLPIKA